MGKGNKLNTIPLLRLLKRGLLRASEQTGLGTLVLDSAWRRQRLLILGYHGISLNDEHHWNPFLYMPPDMLRKRLELLREMRCSVLPLGEAVQRLQAGTLPPRSVAITFDDGFHDFYSLAHPLLQEFGFPVTLFLSTYYSGFNRPVFDSMASYLLWMGRGQTLRWPEVFPEPLFLDGNAPDYGRKMLIAFALKQALSGEAKDTLLAQLAERLGIDYELLCANRVLHLVNRDEAARLTRDGVELQLHTHRHRVSMQRETFLRELEENRRSINAISGRNPSHFCYPGGVHRPEFMPWLREAGVSLATTSEPGLGTRNTEPFLLPRLLDTSKLSATEFRSWLSGAAGFLPRRAHVMSDDQFLQESAGRPNQLLCNEVTG
ncbi:MAG: polysaccharide deacetylase family protein [Acidobacteriota bacterium]|nr:polysaccharide deacetylase family protein [Acidobacteriota bacterium]